ncbi:hypothetical protein FLM48_06815 [Shewanella sp. Scap07]|uniref:hypothetical protein n=1 Tax=Shewanella sp. Scap07 TaxID=2589987 RepID=UPI0015BF0459|nr:hypothetical protein [Shewanella sp. Scap07]QLE84821.1 hypothetical protein FLM48_06815 [Shewanella sp. Scap07]
MEIDIRDTEEYGVIVHMDEITGDEFDDYLSESVYALFDKGEENGQTIFYFGLASSIEKVEKIVGKFTKALNKPMEN